MSDFGGLLSSDYGFKPQGKSAPMAPPKPNKSSVNPNTPFNFEIGGSKSTPSTSNSSPIFDGHDTIFRPNRKSSPNDFSDLGGFNDVLSGGRSKSTGAGKSSSVYFDNIFGAGSGDSGPGFSSLPVFDKPVYDDEDLSSGKYADIFSSSSSPGPAAKKVDDFDDRHGGFSRKETQAARPAGSSSKTKGAEKGNPSFDDLLPGFGGNATNRKSLDATKKTSNVMNDPFVVLESTSPPTSSSAGIFSDPLEEIGNLNNPGRKKVENSASGAVFDDIDPLDGFGKSAPVFSADMSGREKDVSPLRTKPRAYVRQTSGGGDVIHKSSVRSPERGSTKKMPVDDYQESPQSVFEMPSVSANSHSSIWEASPPAYRSSSSRETNSYQHAPSDGKVGSSDDIWLTVSEIPLFTQPTAAPPPSRPPPPRPARFSKKESSSFPTSNAQKKGSEYSSFSGSTPHSQSWISESAGGRGSNASPLDELEDFAMARSHSNLDGSSHVPVYEDFDTSSGAAAAMKETVDKAEAKFGQVRGAKERESARVSRSREFAQVEKEEIAAQDAQQRKFKEHQERLEHERRQRERDEEERRRREEEEKRRIEREREKKRIERERELARQAVDRAAREARERAAAEARARAERAAVQKAQAEARGRAERAAVQRVQAEARERAAAEAKERAEKAAAEARDRARAEAREKEVRERAAATAARESQQKNENDLESFFGTGSRASSAPRPRASSSDASTHFQSKPAEATRTSVNSSSTMRKASSSTNIVDDLSSIFGGPPSSGGFQEVEGETEERRRARLERHQRTQDRAAKALAEKNARDLEVQREQAERNRIGETLDFEIKRWAAGKEGNLRALLSTMQYVLWPECGWQPVSLTDLIAGAAVKKAYRKATLCIHPDKVQQKGATLQQKYIAEKVFDLLKEAWNKFNSEELF